MNSQRKFQEMEYGGAMNTSDDNKRVMKVMLGLLFIGSAALLGLYSATKHGQRPPGIFVIERNGERFVYGAHA
jgi:hypothetical protein